MLPLAWGLLTTAALTAPTLTNGNDGELPQKPKRIERVPEDDAGEGSATGEPGPFAPGIVRVHVVGAHPKVELRRVLEVVEYDNYFLSREAVYCSGACGGIVDGRGGRRFFLARGGWNLTPPISFAALAGDVTVTVRPWASGLRLGGIVGLVLGHGFAIPGLITWSQSDFRAKALPWPFVGGLALVLVGGILVACSGTELDVQPGAPTD